MYKHILQDPMCPSSFMKRAREGLSAVKQTSLVNLQGSGDQYNIYCLKHTDRRVTLQCQSCKVRVCQEGMHTPL